MVGNTSWDIDIVDLPPETGDSVKSDGCESSDDDGLHDQYLPADVPGEAEVNCIEQDESD